MDFFEKAHVAKNDTKKGLKEKKSDEAVKKQLKQMLQGYKQSDNKLIRSIEDAGPSSERALFEDSSSVSGYSDLILSNSSNEANSSLEIIKSDAEDAKSETNEPRKDYIGCKQDSETISSSVGSIVSISECSDDMESLSDISVTGNIEEQMSDLTDNNSLKSRLETITEIDSEESGLFDADGALAAKIFKKLELKDKALKKTKNRKSIELEVTETETEDQFDSQDENVKSEDDVSINYEINTSEELSKESDNVSEQNSNVSSPFVSVTATDMVSQSLSEIIGDYKYSTIKNLPSDIQMVTHSGNDTSIFTVESMAIDDTQIHDVDPVSPQRNEELEENELDFTDHCDEVTPIESTTYDDMLQTEETSDNDSIELAEDFVSPVKVYQAKNSFILVLKHTTELYLHGKVNIRCLGGRISVFGFDLTDQSDRTCQLYAPNYNFAHHIITVDDENAYYGLFGKLTSTGLSVYEAEEIVTSIGEYDGVICLSPLKSKEMDFLENNFTVADVFSKVNRNVDNSLRVASENLGCSLYLSQPHKSYEENPSWRQAIKYGFNEGSRGIVCGGKGVGKSTFLRYCVNHLLSQGPVLVIDLDPGQAEFTVAGSVSATVVTDPLLGPNFTHLKQPDVMLYLGMINTMDNPRRYAAAVFELITYCCSDDRYRSMPWVVNTMGMCNAMGLKFISLIILLTKPTYLLQIDSKNAKKRFECYLSPATIKNMYFDRFQHDCLFKNVSKAEDLEYSFFVCNPMENLGKKDFSLAPRDERYLNYLAYFGLLLRARTETTLLGITPYEVNFRDLYLGMNVKVNEDAALKVINGKVVALCQLGRDNARVFTLTDKPLLCHGHGLIRGVDYENEKLYVITGCGELARVDALVYSDWAPELRGQERALPPGTRAPYRTAAAYQQRQLMFAPRRRFNPIQLIKMSRNS